MTEKNLEHQALITLFGATGDLAWRKLYPSLYKLFQKNFLKNNFAIIGTARTALSDEEYRQKIKKVLLNEKIKNNDNDIEEFISHFYYLKLDITKENEYLNLKKLSDKLDDKYKLDNNKLFYLAVAPRFFETITKNLKSFNIASSDEQKTKIIIEKPFGSNYESALELNNSITQYFTEKQIFRIDHYLGKEMVQNILAIRFGNQIFESLWSNQFIDNIQITFAESIGVEDRGSYYDQSGALKDMVQNHVLQVVSLLAMEPPTTLNERDIRLEKIKALSAIRIYSKEEACQNFVRGQYMTNTIDGITYPSYQQEQNVNPYSTTETFVAGKFLIDNLRWTGVPFFVRSGKRMTEKRTRIDIVFKNLPINLFADNKTPLAQNILTIYIQPVEGFSIMINGKEVGSNHNLKPIKWEFKHNTDTLGNSPEAYEKLILDCLKGDSMNFTHWREVAQSWKIIDAIENGWSSLEGFDSQHIPTYPVGSMGPIEAFKLLENNNCKWFWDPISSQYK